MPAHSRRFGETARLAALFTGVLCAFADFFVICPACVDRVPAYVIMELLLPAARRIQKGACHFSGRIIGKEVKFLCGPAAVREESAALKWSLGNREDRPWDDESQARIPALLGWKRIAVTSDDRCVESPFSREGEAGGRRRSGAWEAHGYGVLFFGMAKGLCRRPVPRAERRNEK